MIIPCENIKSAMRKFAASFGEKRNKFGSQLEQGALPKRIDFGIDTPIFGRRVRPAAHLEVWGSCIGKLAA